VNAFVSNCISENRRILTQSVTYTYYTYTNIYIYPTTSGLRGLEVAFPPHDPSDAGSNPAEVVEFLRTENFRDKVLRKGL
jgi:hypothetical protein